MIYSLISLITKTPLYPHWLEFRNHRRADHDCTPFFRGKVLETGCGNGEKKDYFLLHAPQITSYCATDYSEWDEEFLNHERLANSFGILTRVLYGTAKRPERIDKICDAHDLPFKDRSFHTYCSFEVLEHIYDPDKFFSEANRVLKRGGNCIISMPFLFREHGDPSFDYQRFTKGGFARYAEKYGFDHEKTITYSHFGTTIASLTNQFIIRKILEGSLLVKIVLFPLSPFLFILMNMLGYTIELFDKDERFAARYHMIFRKRRNHETKNKTHK